MRNNQQLLKVNQLANSEIPEVNTGMAYLLWALGFFGIFGIHRFYLGKPMTGLLWFFTLGLFGFGQLVDLFFIPGIAQQRNKYLWEKTRTKMLASIAKSKTQMLNSNLPVKQSQQPKKINRDPMHKLLKAAAAHQNVLSIGQAMLSTELSHEKVEKLLQQALKKGIAYVDNDPQTGSVRYHFDI